jgi:hypothetical protein
MIEGRKRRGSLAIAVAAVLLVDEGALHAARLRPEALEGWGRYVSAVEQRRSGDLLEGRRFLVMDTMRDAAAERRALLAGEHVVRSMAPAESLGHPIDTPGAMVHHWRGAVFLPGANLSALLTSLETDAPVPGRDILRSAVLAREPSFIRVFLRLRRTKIVTVILDTEHDVRFTRVSRDRASSVSVATRVVEVEDAGTPDEHARPAGDDRGFLWRLNAYWRYEAVAGGVIAECESISLSRGVPFGFQIITAPLIGSVAKESMESALAELVNRL